MMHYAIWIPIETYLLTTNGKTLPYPAIISAERYVFILISKSFLPLGKFLFLINGMIIYSQFFPKWHIL